MKNKNIIYIALTTIAILLIPLIAMQFTDDVAWTAGDFVIAGALLFTAGVMVDMAMKKTGKYKVVTVAIIVILFIWLWAELAVGVFTNWGS